MKKGLTLIVVALLLTSILVQRPVKAGKYDWVPMNTGLKAAPIMSMEISTVDPLVLYASTTAGLFVSTDGGDTWWERAIGTEQQCVLVKCIEPSYKQARTALIGTYGKGVFMTTDAGLSWAELNSGITTKDIETIAIDPRNEQVIYVGTYGGGIFKSTNGGKTYTSKNNGLAGNRIKQIVLDVQESSTVYAVLYGGLGMFRSDDGGNSWKAINNGIKSSADLDISVIAVDPVDAGRVYAGTMSTGKVYVSNDYGDNWKEIVAKFPETWVYSIEIDYKNNKVVYFATESGVYKTEDMGVTLKKKTTGLLDESTKVVRINPKENLTIFAGTSSAGVFKSTNGADSWAPKTNGLPIHSIYHITWDATNYKIFLSTSKGIYVSTDNGKTFASSGLSEFIVQCVEVDPKDSNYVYAGTYGKGIFGSENGGASWKKLTSELDGKDIYEIEVDPSDYRTIYVAAYGEGVYRTKDMGATWKQINYGLKDKDVTSIEIDPSNTKVIYASTYGGGVFKSTNGGDSWNAINKGLSSYDVTCIKLNQKDSKVLYAGTYGGGVFKSVDSGENWVEFNKSLENKYILDLAIHYYYTNTLAVATTEGVFFVENFGTTWEKMNQGLTDARVFAVSFDAKYTNYIYAGTLIGGFFRKSVTRIIKATATEGGTISPSGDVEVLLGGEVTFTMTPSEGYELKKLVFAGKDYQAYTSFKVTQVAVNNSIQAVFEKKKPSQTIIILQIGNKNFTVNGTSKELDSPPIIKNNRTLLPIRAVVESLGGTVGWDGGERKVTISLGNTSIELWIGKSKARVNGVEKQIDPDNPNVVPEIINSRTMLPVRFVVESLGAKVEWEDSTKTITITYPAP